ncbi:MAG: peptide chain release factor N(5)-glutamine methyltransferase [Ramlibacter sp.]
MNSIAQALQAGAAMGLERLDAQLLLLHALGRASTDRGWLLAHDTDKLDPGPSQRFQDACRRRTGGEPVAYIVGRKEFFGLELVVDPRVLVPRPETETLVEWALEVLPHAAGDSPSVIDLGTGSGAIALAIKQQRPDAQVEAVDASSDALAVARANAQALSLAISFRQASWLDGAGSYDLIASNPPYVAQDDPHLAALRHEPLGALAAGPDGLRDIRLIITQATTHLRRGGWLLLEHGYDQAPAARSLLDAAGFSQVASRGDLAGIDRCSGGQWLELG